MLGHSSKLITNGWSVELSLTCRFPEWHQFSESGMLIITLPLMLILNCGIKVTRMCPVNLFSLVGGGSMVICVV